MANYKIAIDGASGTGKSTIAKELSQKLNIEYINTGLMYRAATYLTIQKGIIGKEQETFDFLKNINFKYIDGKTIQTDNKLLSFDKLMKNEISTKIFNIANSELIRPIIVDNLIKIYQSKDSLLMEGRDITTVIMKDCKNKFFITAPAKVRAERRVKQLNLPQSEFNIVLEQINERDYHDSNRKLGPLLIAKDAIIIDTSKQNIKEIIKLIINKLK